MLPERNLVKFTAFDSFSPTFIICVHCRFHMYNGNNPPLTPGEESEIFAQPPKSGTSSVKVCLALYSVLCSLLSALCSLYSVLCTLFSVPRLKKYVNKDVSMFQRRNCQARLYLVHVHNLHCSIDVSM